MHCRSFMAILVQCEETGLPCSSMGLQEARVLRLCKEAWDGASPQKRKLACSLLRRFKL